MKKIIFLVFIFIFISQTLSYRNNNQHKIININGKNYKLLVSDTFEERQKGLMFYKNKKELKGADGMIFIFPDYDYRSFWNKNTYLDLDVYWLKDEKIVGKDHLPSFLKSKKIITVTSKEKVNQVIEIIKE